MCIICVARKAMGKVQQLNPDGAASRPAPKRIMRPCDYGLKRAIGDMETQVGTVEAYNKLCDAAAVLKAKIDAGDGRAAMSQFATDPDFIYPQKT